jgi:hypothetical protein
MPDSSTNPDGTKQVSPPTRSAFAKPADDGKAPKAEPAAPAENRDNVDHGKNLLDSLKGLIQQHKDPVTNVNERSALDALNKGVSEAPGDSASY